MRELYFDSNATTEPDPSVVEAVARAMRDLPGNPSSAHLAGRHARAAVEKSREQVGAALGCAPSRVVFTGGATEANNIALIGAWRASLPAASARRRVIIGATEHPSVLEAAESLASEGAEVTLLPVDTNGSPDLEAWVCCTMR